MSTASLRWFLCWVQEEGWRTSRHQVDKRGSTEWLDLFLLFLLSKARGFRVRQLNKQSLIPEQVLMASSVRLHLWSLLLYLCCAPCPCTCPGAQMLDSVRTLIQSLSTACCCKWLTLLLWNIVDKETILKEKVETNSLRTSYCFIWKVLSSQRAQFEML